MVQYAPTLPLPFFLRNEAVSEHLTGTFRSQDISAFGLIARVKIVSIAIIIIYLAITLPLIVATVPITFSLLLAFSAFLHLRLEESRHAANWHRYAFMAFDVCLIPLAALMPSPFLNEAWPAQMSFRFNPAIYSFIFVGFAALTYSPRLVVWTGFVASLSWFVAGTVYVHLPDTVTMLDVGGLRSSTAAERLTMMLKPTYLSISNLTQAITILMILSLTLSVGVWRTKRLINRQMGAERERTNLSRYFSPGMVEELSQSDTPLGTVRSQNVAILFADIRGFTTFTEKSPPDAVIGLLREFHRRMADAVFAHSGTIDKYIGDAVMATFGTPKSGAHDALNAIRCAEAMVETLKDWNVKRQQSGLEPLEVAIGVHFGPVVLGDIGDERRLEFAVIGDAVNVASRLEGIAAERDVTVAISQETVEAAKNDVDKDTGRDQRPFPNVKEMGETIVRGRKRPVQLYTFD